MPSLTRWVLAHKRTVVIAWIALTVGGVLAAGPATAALTQEFSVPDKEGSVTNVEIAKRYAGTGGDAVPLLPVVALPAGKTVESPGVRSDLAKIDTTLAKALPGARIASYASTGDRTFVSHDGRTVYALVYPTGADASDFGSNSEAARKASAALAGATVGGAPVHVTGFDALEGESGGSEGPGVLAEAIIGGLGALVVLLFVFASALAVVPILMAVVSIMTTFVLLLGLTELTAVSPIVQFLIALIGLGVAIDYALLVVSRWREERTHGQSATRPCSGRWSPPAAPSCSAAYRRDRPARAGRAAAAVPALDGLRRDADPARLDARRDHAAAGRAGDDRAAAGLAAPAHRRQGQPRVDALGRRRLAPPLARRRRRPGRDRGARGRVARPPARRVGRLHDREGGQRQDRARRARGSGIGEGALPPHEILIDGSTSPAKVAAAVGEVDGIHGAVAPGDPAWHRGGTSIVDAIPVPDGGSDAGGETLAGVRDAAHASGRTSASAAARRRTPTSSTRSTAASR